MIFDQTKGTRTIELHYCIEVEQCKTSKAKLVNWTWTPGGGCRVVDVETTSAL